MKCLKCKSKKEMIKFLAGNHGTFVQIYEQYVCLDCGFYIENNGKEHRLECGYMELPKELLKSGDKRK